MKNHRVFILLRHPLFAQAVESLLQGEEGIEVVGIDTDAQRALERIKVLQPDILVVDENDEDEPLIPGVSRIFQESLGLRMIGLKVGSNELVIYSRQQRTVTRPEDLVEAIRTT
ncbi:MAG: hypothetical protein ACE5MB_00230 [Anaerolineae bacterium]